jgi:lipopolysaccharide/colanic/teichoic acid biosynthesis glycosyltransferase
MLKRTLDIIIAIGCLLVFSPLLLLCYLAIKMGGGPAIYKQERIGLGGKPLYIYKFRSMVVDAEKEGEELLQQENLLETKTMEIHHVYQITVIE